MVALPPPHGVYVPVPTFFVSRNSPRYNAAAAPLDLETQAKHSLHLARCGIRGLVLLGSTGEAVALTNAERVAVISHVRQSLAKDGYPDYPLVAGTATQGIVETVQQLKEAKDAGAQWGLCLAPGYFAPQVTPEGIEAWYRAVADESPLPIMIYHYPGVSNNLKIPPSTFAALSQHPNIVGCKLSHGDVSHHAQVGANPKIDHKHFATFTGLGQQLLPVLALGCAGTIDGSAGFFPRSVVFLYNLCVNKMAITDEETRVRRSLQYKLSAVEELVVKYGTVGIKEATSRIIGFGDRDGTRLPLYGGIPGGDAEWSKWTEAMGALEAVEKSLAEKAAR